MKRVMNARQSDAFKVEATLEKDSLVAGCTCYIDSYLAGETGGCAICDARSSCSGRL